VYSIVVAVRHLLPLDPDSESIFRQFKRTQVQQCILKSQRDGVEVRLSTTCDDLLLFYDLHLQTRRRVGTPIQPKRFFMALWAELFEAGLGFVVLAYKNMRLIAGAVFLAWNGTVIYKYSASDPDYWKLRPNNLVLWTAIQWGCTHEYRQFDFGKTDLDNKGLRYFKNGWGTTESLLTYSYFADKPPKRTSNAMKHILAKIIQHSPTIVCRGVGEILYGHFA
jgi:lipid II:glycine glycyltransferase (peptidoglycan interpeptide bridge formation enzyme)